MSTIVDEALRYREELGLGVFPVDPVTKKPRFAKWQRGGLKAPASIQGVFGRNLDAAVGITGGQILAYDRGDPVLHDGIPVWLARYHLTLDVDERKLGIEALEALPPMPRTPTAKTPGGYHFEFWSRTPVAPFTRPDGIEIKARGTFTIKPPAPERVWTLSPFEYPIAEAPGFLLERPQEQGELLYNPSTGEWSVSYGDPFELVRQAKPGARRPTLVQQIGTVRHHFVRTGRLEERAAREQLAAAALANGTEPAEIERILGALFDSPLLRSPMLGQLAVRSTPLRRSALGSTEQAVLQAVCGRYEPELSHGVPLPVIRSRITSLRWLSEQSGVSKSEVDRVLPRLRRYGLVWKAPSVRLKGRGRERACSRYRPTFAGLALRGSRGESETQSSADPSQDCAATLGR
jgi:hypothetical protein